MIKMDPVAPGQSYVRKVAHLQVVVDKAVWGIFDNTNGLYLQVNTLLVIYKSQDYSIYVRHPLILIPTVIPNESKLKLLLDRDGSDDCFYDQLLRDDVTL